jgi:hypothetical protein
MSCRDYARDVIGKVRDGDYRARFGFPDITVAELATLREAAE